jgi:hypothetical protein
MSPSAANISIPFNNTNPFVNDTRRDCFVPHNDEHRWRGLAVRADYIRQNGTGYKPAPAKTAKNMKTIHLLPNTCAGDVETRFIASSYITVETHYSTSLRGARAGEIFPQFLIFNF